VTANIRDGDAAVIDRPARLPTHPPGKPATETTVTGSSTTLFLIDRHGRGNYADHTLKLTFPRNPNGLYLLKGGGRDVWKAFGVPKSWRKGQGLIAGKRCGTTENVGPAARQRWRNRLQQVAAA
jgi:hypothetical protein